ncbi:helix-turn-helix domain-containing protein [Congregibacter brevis]|uniref:Helix-turn-helix domain-containing protein n=1 Tax=Congregibacter brevis TaxID=3081201 RepID=A0ABZ0IHH7_9GAMM|nr:helix-turn-helix domain-containing protein [Congregibacter sp. IMCC45268]
MSRSTKHQTRGVLAQRSGVKAETIRYYENVMLMSEPERSSGGYRIYTEDDYQRLCFIRRCRDMGFSITEIRGLLSLVDGDQVSCEQVKRMADAHLADIARKIDGLKKMQRTLHDLSSNCSGDDVPHCPIVEALQLV